MTVLFADLVGFTTLSEHRDSEEVRELLTRYFDTAHQIISRYGGVVEKFIGDAVMAVWGTPVAQEDDAERAVRAALDLTQAVVALGQEIGVPGLKARAGVLTGKAAVTVGAQGQGMVAGDLVNTASRIQSTAPPGAVFVGESSKRATEAAVAYEGPHVRTLKGKSAPLPLWRAVRVVGLRRGVLRSMGLEPPFVGRDRELRFVKELFHASLEEKRAQLVSVGGIAGIGKSRLSWEFFKYVDGLADTVLWHRGRCLAYGEGVAYWALAEMIKMRAGIIDEEDSESSLAKLRATLEEHVPDPEERGWVEPRLAHLLGLEGSPTPDRDSLFAAWRLFVERMAAQAPVVMVFEDLQWADASLLDFIDYLLDWSRNHSLFIMTFGRPEFADKRPDWGAGRRSFASLYLEPLPPHAMKDLLSGLIPGLPEDLLERILARAEGVPLYAVETVRMLIDRGLLVREGSVYRLTGTVERLDVPETLHALIAARLDGLTSEERRIVQDGSVLGQTFTVPALAYLSGCPEAKLQTVLASLVRKEVLALQAEPRSPERGHYRFLQDLLKRVAYETLSKRERKARRLAAASFLETGNKGDDEDVEVIAAHYLEAYRELPEAPDAEEVRHKARETLIRAGHRAASLAAQAEAEDYFCQAASLADDLVTRARLLERAGQMAYQGGRLDRAKAHFENAMELFESQSDRHAAARVSARLGDIDWEQGRLVDPVDRMERAFAVLSREEPDEDLATLAAQLGRLHMFKGEMDVARERLETALEIAEPLGLPEVVAQALNTKGVVLLFDGRMQEALALTKHALEVALEHDLPVAALRAYVNLGESLFRRDRFEESLATYEEGLALARRVGNRAWEWALLAEMAFPLLVVGRWDDALEGSLEIPATEMARADILGPLLALPVIYVNRRDLTGAKRILNIFSRYESSEDVQERAAHAVGRAVTHSAEGNLREALRAARDAVELGARIGPDNHMLKMGLDQGLEAALAQRDLGAAEELLGIIDALRPAEMTPLLVAIGAHFHARLAEAQGLQVEAQAGYKQASGMFREIGAPYWLATTLVDFAGWMVAQGSGEEAEPLVAEASRIFQRLDAQAWLERVGRMSPTPATEAAPTV